MKRILSEVLYKKIFLYIPNEFNIFLSDSLKKNHEYEYDMLHLNFYQQENFYLINYHKNIFNTTQNIINKEMMIILSNLDTLSSKI